MSHQLCLILVSPTVYLFEVESWFHRSGRQSLKMSFLHLLTKSSLPPATDSKNGMVNSGADRICDSWESLELEYPLQN